MSFFSFCLGILCIIFLSIETNSTITTRTQFEKDYPITLETYSEDIFITSESTIIPRGSFVKFPNTTYFLGIGYDIVFIEPGAFTGLTNLQNLVLWYNKIRVLVKGTFDGLPALESLSLEGNPINYIEPHTFSPLNHLRLLGFGNHQNYRAVLNDTFHGLLNLRTLRIDYCAISVIDKYAFRGLKSLKELSLDYNLLTAIPTAALLEIPSLKKFRINYNKIESIESSTLVALFEKLELLSISGNPIICSEIKKSHTRKSSGITFVANCPDDTF